MWPLGRLVRRRVGLGPKRRWCVRTAFVHGHQRQFHDEFVLDDRLQVGPGIERQQVFLAIVVLRLGRGFIGHETEPPVHGQFSGNCAQAALASEWNLTSGLQMQPDLRRRAGWTAARFAPGRPAHHRLRVDRAMQIPAEAAQVGQRQFTGQEFPGPCEPLGIEAAKVERSRRGLLSSGHRAIVGRGHHNTRMSDLLSPARSVVLGSTSPYRRELMQRLGLPFEVLAPGVDEAPEPGETPAALAQRLALAKARAVARQRPAAVVIGSDQVADLNGEPLGKPGTHERAVEQLRRMRGQTVVFQTALAVVCLDSGYEAAELAPVRVRFRDLDDGEIERYLRAEQPYDCAGSAKSEGLGIALLERIDSDDPTALVGLPLIRTCRLLRAAGVRLP